MNTTRTIRGKMLVAMLASLLASATVRADDMKFLPDGCEIVGSVDFAAFLKGKMYPAAKDLLRLERSIESVAREHGLKIANLGRVTISEGEVKDGEFQKQIRILTPLKTVTAAQIKEVINREESIKNLTYTDSQVGMYVIHQPRYQLQFGKELRPGIVTGHAFSVVAPKMLVFGNAETLKSVLERKKTANSPNLEAGLSSNGLKDTFDMVVDVKALWATKQRIGLNQMADAVPGMAALLDGIHTVSLRGNEKDRFHGTATVWCKDTIHAAKVRKFADEGVVLLKALFKDSEDHSAERRKLNKDLREVLDAVRLGVVDSQVRAELSVDPVTAINAFAALVSGETKRSPEPK